MLAGWLREAQPKLATADQWMGYISDLAAVSGVNAPANLRRFVVVRWKDALLDRGDAVKTINDSKLAALKAILNWGVANGRLEVNVAQGVGVRRKKKPGQNMLGDRGYHADWFRNALTARGIAPCIPSRANRTIKIDHDKSLYRQRHKVENMFGRLKDWRRIHTGYDRCAHKFMSAICIAATVIFWL